MIFYFVPEAGIFGGVKVAFQLVELLHRLGRPAVAVLPDGRAPTWFASRAPVVAEAEAMARIGPDDWLMLTWPPDHARLAALPGRRVNHCQGTDPRMDAIFADEQVLVLTCWRQATRWVHERFARLPVEVGISIADEFFFAGGRKLDELVAYMPRRGNALARRCMRAARTLDFLPIDGVHERAVARLLSRAGIFVATAVGEEFGLPALEAMAAGCVVVSVPVKGGMEFLRDGENCIVADASELGERLDWIARPENASLRCVLRQRAVATAMAYRRVVQQRRLADLLDGPLAELGS